MKQVLLDFSNKKVRNQVNQNSLPEVASAASLHTCISALRPMIDTRTFSFLRVLVSIKKQSRGEEIRIYIMNKWSIMNEGFQ